VNDFGNLFEGFEGRAAAERFDTLLSRPGLRVERIVSTGQAGAPGQWYDQPQTEWVVLLSGSAVLRFEDEADPRVLRPGDWMIIAPHRRHRVEATDGERPSVWLAVHASDELHRLHG
jgi:cupin 2 domain-containing protein